MPLEYRLIQFKEQEIEEAIDRWMRAHGHLGQYGRIAVLSMVEIGREVSIDIETWDVQGGRKQNLRPRVISHDEVRQAVLLFCKEHTIPLAHRGKKIIRVMDQRVAMYYNLQ